MRYYFHVRLKGKLFLDRDGIEMNDIVEVRVEAEKLQVNWQTILYSILSTQVPTQWK